MNAIYSATPRNLTTRVFSMILAGLFLVGCVERGPRFRPDGDAIVAGCLVVEPSGAVQRNSIRASTMGMPAYDAKLVWRKATTYGQVPAIDHVVFDSKTMWYSQDPDISRTMAPARGEVVTEEVILLFDAKSEIVGLGRVSTMPPCPIGQPVEAKAPASPAQ